MENMQIDTLMALISLKVEFVNPSSDLSDTERQTEWAELRALVDNLKTRI